MDDAKTLDLPSHTKNKVSRLWSTPVLATTALILTIWSADNFRPNDQSGLLTGFILMLLGGLILLAALHRNRVAARWPQLETAFSPTDTKMSLGDVVKMGLGGVALLLLALANSPSPPEWLPRQSVDMQFILLFSGIFLLTWGLSGVRLSGLWQGWRAMWRREYVLLLLITMLAFALQLWMLEDAVHIFVDEFHVMNGVIDLWIRTDVKILTPFSPMAAFPWLYPYFESVTIALFGHTYTGVRFASVIFGTLTIPALYVLAKNLFDRPTAVIAALFLATFPPHIHLSRLGMVNAADPFWGTWLLAFLARGIRQGRRYDFVLAGLCLGLTQYFYEGGKLLFPALAGAWITLLLIFHYKYFPIRGLGYLLLTALLVALPLYAVLASWNFSFSPRMDETGTSGLDWGAILSLRDEAAALRHYVDANLLPPLLHLIQRPDSSHFYYGGDTALILQYMLPLFYLGIFHALWRWRVAGVLLLLWVALTILGNSLLLESVNAWSARFMVVFPALALLMAVGLRYTLPLLKVDVRRFIPHLPVIEQKWQQVGLGVFAVILVLPQPLYYFRDHLPLYNVQVRPYYDHIDAFDRGRLLPPNTTLIFVSDDAVYTDHFTTLSAFWRFNPLVVVLKAGELTPDYLASLSSGGYGFFIDPNNAVAPALLRTYFDTLTGPQSSPYNVPLERQYVLYYLPSRPS